MVALIRINDYRYAVCNFWYGSDGIAFAGVAVVEVVDLPSSDISWGNRRERSWVLHS